MKKGNLGKLALIGAGLYAAKVLTDKNEEEKTLNSLFAGLPQTTQTENGEIPFSPDQFKKWIDANPALKAALRSGVTADQVVQNINNNSYNLTGVLYESFGRSLMANSAFELNTLSGWNVGTLVLEGSNLGLPVGKISANVLAINSFYVKPDRLYSVTYQGKVPVGNLGIILKCYDRDLVAINKDSGTNDATNNANFAVNSSTFISRKLYFGGISQSIAQCFATGTVKCKVALSIYNNSGGFGYINDLVVNEISLGEPVPSNLAYLPTGQMVYDTTTWEVGIYNGTAVVWFAV